MALLSCVFWKSEKMRFSGREKALSGLQPDFFTSFLAWGLAVVPVGLKSMFLSPTKEAQGKIALKIKEVQSIVCVLSIPLQSYLSSKSYVWVLI